MKKINNKAFTIVELIITFSIVMTISLGLFKVVDSYKEKQQQESFKKELNSYINEVVKAIKDDVIKLGITKIEGTTCYDDYNQGITITFDDASSKKLCVGNNYIDKNGIKYGDILYKAPSKFVIFKDDILLQKSGNYDLKNVNYIVNYIDKIKMSYLTESFYSINIKINHTELKKDFDINIVVPKKAKKEVSLVRDPNYDDVNSNNYLDRVVYSDIYGSVDFSNKFINELDLSDSSLETVNLSSLSSAENLIINKLIIGSSAINNSYFPEIIENSTINELVFSGKLRPIEKTLNFSNVKKVTIISSDTDTNIDCLKGSLINELDLTELSGGVVNLEKTVINKLYISNSITDVIKDNIEDVSDINSLIIVQKGENKNLESIPSSLKNKINNLVIGDGITTIGSNIASGFGIRKVKFPTTLETIGESAFKDNKLEELDLSNTKLTTIRNGCFSNNKIKNVKFPTTLGIIGEFAFKDNQLEELDLLNTKLATIPNGCFSNNKIKNVKFPTTITSIETSAFIENEGLTCDGTSTCTFNG